jgi:hypothetical protein
MKRLCLLFSFAIAACAQTAQITGRIIDMSEAAVPDVQVVVTSASTGAVSKTVSNTSGVYTVPLLPIGTYAVTIQKAGFRPMRREGVTLAVDQVARLDFTLEIGQMTQSVEVTAAAPMLEQSTSSLGQVVDSSKILSIPLNGRSAFRLVQLTPGVLASPGANGQFGDMPVNTTWDSNFAINGGRSQSNEVQIDGVPSTAGFFNQITTIPSVEATQEFKVQSNNLSAEWGRSGGGALNVSTRSGTNEFHGSVFEFLRNSAFDANEFFNNRAGRAKPPFRMNQFGGSAGGRLIRNKTFFFGDYQGSRWRRGDVFFTTVPTALERNGDFTRTLNNRGQQVAIYDPLTSRADPARPGQFIRTPFAGNVIPTGRINGIAKKTLDYYPVSNTAGDASTNFNNFASNAARAVDQNSIGIRLDHTVNDRYRLFGRFARNVTDLTQPDYYSNVASPDPGAVGRTPFRQHTFAFDNTVTLTPTQVLDVRYGFARWYQLRLTRSYGFDQRSLGFPDKLVSQFQIPVFPTFNVEQYGNLSGQSYLNNGNDTHSILPSVTWVKGKQTIKYGGDLRLRRINYFSVAGAGGNYTFNRTYTRGPDPNTFNDTSGNAVASMLLGYPASASVNTEAGQSLQNYYMSGYVQNDIRLTAKVTLNLGVRYETESPYTERRNQLVWFDSSLKSPVANAQYPDLKGGLRFAGTDGSSRYVYGWDKNNIAPRAGIAYSATSRTVIRVGAGLFYAPLEISNNAVGFTPNMGYSASTPFVASLDSMTPLNTLADPFGTGIVQPTRNTLGSRTYLGQGITAWDPNAITPTVWQWNFNVQQQVARDLTVDVAYAGSRGIHLTRAREQNALDPKYLSLNTALQAPLVSNPFFGSISTGALAQRTIAPRQLLLPYPQYTGVNFINSTSANSNYHSIQLKVEKRFANDMSFLLAFTGAKLIADANNQLAAIGPANSAGPQNWYNLKAEKAVSEMDVSRNLTFSYVAGLPFGTGKHFLNKVHGPVGRIVSGWQVNGIVVYRSGLPLNVTAPITGGGNRPNSTGRSARIDGDRSRSEQIRMWFETTAFLLPPSYTLGNVGRTLPDVRSPNLINVDFSLIKNTKLWERTSLQFRAEAFNALNRPNFWVPATGMGNNQFGQINSTTGLPRVLQVALKLMF